MPLSVSEAGILGLAVESVAYGVYILVVSSSLAILLSKRSQTRESVRLSTIITVCFLFLLSSLYLFVDIANGVQSVSSPDDGQETLTRTTDALFTIIAFFSELVLIHRCWAIWAYNYLTIVFPTLLSLTSLVSGLVGIAIVSNTDPNATISPKAAMPLETTSFVLSLCVNVIATTLIILRIWMIARAVRAVPSTNISIDRVQTALEIIIESGIAMLGVQLIFVILFTMNNVAQLIAVSFLSQVYGIAPTLVIVRVGMREAAEQIVDTDTDQTIPMSHRPVIYIGAPMDRTSKGCVPEKSGWDESTNVSPV